MGLSVEVHFEESPKLRDTDLVVVLDRYLFQRQFATSPTFADQVERLSQRYGGIAYFDTGDSAGLVRAAVLPRVRAYLKPFLLRDRQEYGNRHYGGRVFTDHAHRRYGVEDREPIWSDAVSDPELLRRLHLGWSPAIYPYDVVGNRIAKLYTRIPIAGLLQWPGRYCHPDAKRTNVVSCRISVAHARATVAHQRLMLQRKLSGRVDTGVISRRAYINELSSSRVVISPFGWGEYAIRDYETFVSGAALLKPDMSHLETWPDLYQPGATYIPVNWDWSSLPNLLDLAERNIEEFLRVAMAGQRNFRNAANDGIGFARHVSEIVESAL
jgi:hypothetical protein